MILVRRFLLFHPSLVLAVILVAIRVGCGQSEPPKMVLDLDRLAEVIGWVCSGIEKLPGRIDLDLKPISVSQAAVSVQYPYRVRLSIYSSGTPGREFFDPPLEYGEVVRLHTFLREPPCTPFPERSTNVSSDFKRESFIPSA